MTDEEVSRYPIDLQRIWVLWKEHNDCYEAIEEALQDEPETLREFYLRHHDTDDLEVIQRLHKAWENNLSPELRALWDLYRQDPHYMPSWWEVGAVPILRPEARFGV